jgi:hypothetical protein
MKLYSMIALSDTVFILRVGEVQVFKFMTYDKMFIIYFFNSYNFKILLGLIMCWSRVYLKNANDFYIRNSLYDADVDALELNKVSVP